MYCDGGGNVSKGLRYPTSLLAEVFTSSVESRQLGEWLAISSRINTSLFSLFRQSKQPSRNPNRLASPKFNLVFACGYIAKRQHPSASLLTKKRKSPRTISSTPCGFFKLNKGYAQKENRKGQKCNVFKIICLLSIQSGLRENELPLFGGRENFKGNLSTALFTYKLYRVIAGFT